MHVNLSSDDESSPTATQLYHKHQKLPQDIPKLGNVPERLKGLSDYNTWSSAIESTLNSAGIPQIIQTSIAHPPLSDPSYPLWHRTSLSVKNWLVHQLSAPFLSRLLTFNKTQANSPLQPFRPTIPLIYADALYAAIRRVARRHYHASRPRADSPTRAASTPAVAAAPPPPPLSSTFAPRYT